ncbi:IS982 family transposase [Pedobacter psychrodurus]|uniref:IS982 family transposase n=1 Tax=Pedobacter psychrodurus TaxID=2530456 RepID=A0A4R0PEW7_9SPHI|nr:IS982 family transposase [Pedobacter psychrodurus]TCD13949.1 IS982 family transposase [Pedobacter psychrodurus]
MHCIKSNFDKIMRVLNDVLGSDMPAFGTLLRPGPKTKFSDIEIIALSFAAEAAGVISENHLFNILNSDYKTSFPNLISRRQYNDRLRNLFHFIEDIRKKMVNKMNALTDVFAIDSMPIEICKLSREHRNTLGKDHAYAQPAKGFCASQNKYFYGYKLHAVCSPSGVVQLFDLGNAKIHDIHYLKEIAPNFRNCIITGDRGYVSDELKKHLLRRFNISLEVPSRSNQKVKSKVIKPLRVIRKRMETVFSQLCLQFKMQVNLAKQFLGFKTRILAKITCMTMLQYINYVSGKPIGKIKSSLS